MITFDGVEGHGYIGNANTVTTPVTDLECLCRTNWWSDKETSDSTVRPSRVPTLRLVSSWIGRFLDTVVVAIFSSGPLKNYSGSVEMWTR
jgi:hypothetical protein